jgi:gentisate 1,2-dioxygenase
MLTITTDLYAGVQLALPGEVAAPHRHAQGALRFVLEANGGHATVDGGRTIMHEGDFIMTPPMASHDHGKEYGRPIFWLDGPDIPIVQLLDAFFAEHPRPRRAGGCQAPGRLRSALRLEPAARGLQALAKEGVMGESEGRSLSDL